MKKLLFLSCFFVAIHVCAQEALSDSMKMAIKIEFFARERKDQMKDFPEFMKHPSDSLKEIRHGYFRSNFNYLIEITKKYGFLKAKQLSGPRDYVIGEDYKRLFLFPGITILHIFQTYPKMLLTDEVIELFAKEIANGNMPSNSISDALVFYTKFSKPCVDDMERMNYALKKWGLKPLENKEFFVCN